MQLFRADKRDFAVGDQIGTANHYYSKFDQQKQQLEDRLEELRPQTKSKRRDCLFLFESEDDAIRHWAKMTGGKLYKVEIQNGGILHRADMKLLDDILRLIQSSKPYDELCHQYWNSVMTPKPTIEVIVASGTICEIISKSDSERIAAFKRIYGIQ